MCAACVLAYTNIDFIDENTGCQILPGNRVHIGERALALNSDCGAVDRRLLPFFHQRASIALRVR
jgi:hypothetical protein